MICPYCGKDYKNTPSLMRHLKFFCKSDKLGNYAKRRKKTIR